MKQTAVEWLHEQLKQWTKLNVSFNTLIEQAEQMNREQITHAYHDGRIDTINKNIKPMEQYYNETYGKEKQ